MIGYHVTTERKVARYKNTRAILPPVRFWPNLTTARRWAKRTGRNVIIKIKTETFYPLPDHKPAYWTPDTIYSWDEVNELNQGVAARLDEALVVGEEG